MDRVGGVLGITAAALLGVGLAVSTWSPPLAPGTAAPEGPVCTLAPLVAVEPPAEPCFTLGIPADFQWAQEDTRDLLLQCWRALRDYYLVAPPYRWRVVYGPQNGPGRYDLPVLPRYEGQGQLRLSQDYLAAPPDDERWAHAGCLGTLEGMAYAFHEYLGLDHTSLSEGLAAYTARDLGPALWGGLRAGEMNVIILGFEEREELAVAYWRGQGRPPEGMDRSTFDRQRGIALWRRIAAELSPALWRRFFWELQAGGILHTAAGDRRQGDRLVRETLEHLARRDWTAILREYGYEPVALAGHASAAAPPPFAQPAGAASRTD